MSRLSTKTRVLKTKRTLPGEREAQKHKRGQLTEAIESNSAIRQYCALARLGKVSKTEISSLEKLKEHAIKSEKKTSPDQDSSKTNMHRKSVGETHISLQNSDKNKSDSKVNKTPDNN